MWQLTSIVLQYLYCDYALNLATLSVQLHIRVHATVWENVFIQTLQ